MYSNVFLHTALNTQVDTVFSALGSLYLNEGIS